jgi:hypothetical protein
MYNVCFTHFLINGLKKLTALTENQISETEAIYVVMCSVPYTGPSNQGFQF